MKYKSWLGEIQTLLLGYCWMFIWWRRERFSKSGTRLINNACYQLSLATVYRKMCVTLTSPVIAKFVHNALAWSSFFSKNRNKDAQQISVRRKKFDRCCEKNWPSSTFNYTSSFTDRSVDEGNNTTRRCCSISRVVENNGSRLFRTFCRPYVILTNKVWQQKV